MKNLFEIISKGVLIALLISPNLLAAQYGYAATEILNSASEKSKSKKAEKAATEYTTHITTPVDEVPIMRVPEAKIKSSARATIILVQNELEAAHKKYLTNEHTGIKNTFAYYFDQITSADPNWVVSSYQEELKFYQDHDRSITERERQEAKKKALVKQREKHAQDSLARLERLAQTAKRDSLDKELRLKRIAQTKLEDSLAYLNRTKGFHFVNTEYLNLREKPNVSAKVIAKVGACSYVTIIPGYESNGWTKIAVGNYQGYVNEDYLVGNLDDITVTGADVAFAKKSYFTSVETAATYAAPYRKAVDTRTYYTGPRGGCYYINDNGRKEYVDHSFCD